MAIVLITPIATQTKNGNLAEVTGIDLSGHDCLTGRIGSGGAGRIEMRWNKNGRCRGAGDGCSLDITTPEVADVLETAKKLRAQDLDIFDELKLIEA
ncbi:hypothetical protein RZS28_06785 [Methylocapsa polymorpha]|uniref:Uncharacterized protein n=1 Tax=Methylocapsa polymorpha TaxID=3080828 RepID=A0ABZ0HUN1_9HYPH|nr:hypothetical protein RZS28_06785 [Methylocapsa sp. RX1]